MNGEKHIEFISVKKTIEGEDIIVSNHKIGDKKLEKLLKGKVLYKDSSLSRSAGVHPQTPSENNIGNFDDSVKFYAGIPDALKHLDNFEQAVLFEHSGI